MKKTIFNKYTIVLALWVGLIGCEDDVKYLENYGRTFNATPNICIDHINVDPATGEELTEEEEIGLDYDPCKKAVFYNTYDIENNDLDLVFTSDIEPLRVEVQDPSTRETIDVAFSDVVQEDGLFKSTATVSFANLGIAELGDKAAMEFVAVYDLGETTGELLQLRTPFAIEYKLFLDPNAVVPYAFLKKSTGETEGLVTIGDGDISNITDNIYVGRELTFDGNDDMIEIVETPSLAFRQNNDFSVGLWVKTTGDYNDPSIISDKDWVAGANPGFVMAYKGASAGVWKLNVGDGSNRIDIDGGSINDDQWHFIMATLDRDGDAIIYQDGIEVGRTNMAAIGNIGSGFPMRLAQDGTGSYGDWFVGNLGEVFVYDYVVSPEEAADAAAQRTGVQIRRQDGSFKNLSVTPEGGTLASDDEGKFTFALDGVDDYVTIEDPDADLSFTHDGNFSAAVWVKTEATNSDPVIFGNRQWEGGSHVGALTAFTGGDWRAVTADGPNRVNLNNVGTINDGVWHLITVTWDRSGDMTVYQDGVRVSSADITGVTGTLDSGFPWRLGQDADANYGDWFEGSLAECVFFDYVLSDAEVLALYSN